MLNVSNNRVWKWYRRHHRVVGVLLEIAAEAIPGGKLVVTALQMAAAAVEDKVDAEILALLEAVQPVVSGLVDEIEHAPDYQPDMSAEALRRTVIQGEIAQELAPLLPQLGQSISRSVANRSGGKVVLDGRYELGKHLVAIKEPKIGMEFIWVKGDDYPVENISWDDADYFVDKLNQLGNGTYRLPTEAEWEYAARSGGKAETYSGSENIDKVAWYDGNSGGSTHPVGKKQPNGLGLYDMSGNVWEWCYDWYGCYPSSPEANPLDNPRGPDSVSFRVLRGGRCRNSAKNCRTADRHWDTPGFRYDLLGARLVRRP